MAEFLMIYLPPSLVDILKNKYGLEVEKGGKSSSIL